MTDRRVERWLVTSGATSLLAQVRSAPDDAMLEVEIGSGNAARTMHATILSCSADTCVVAVEGRTMLVRVAPCEQGHHAMAGGESFTVASAVEAGTDVADGGGSGARASSPGIDLDALCAPMPATVSAILVEPGANVQAGDNLVRLEAMKMELAIRAPWSGRVTAVDCRVGDLVQPGRPLVTLEAPLSRASKVHG